ncbi:MAG TPA: GntR family transcriptional regulator [Bacillales bacterium]|nr:GntR family transcriptional regulator [Bacillales bacterium]
MILELDLQSETPIYMQIKYEIMRGMAIGQLHPGEALPSVRMLAADLGINMHTVNKAYQLLKQDGFILIHRQKGVVVNPDGMPKADEEFVNRLRGNLQPHMVEAMCRGMGKAEIIDLISQIFEPFEKEGE